MRASERQISMAVPWMGHFVMEGNLLRQLVRDAKAGDVASFERIVILHECLVLRVAQRILLDGEDAKDAAQEVFIRLHRTLGRFDEEKDLGPWLYRLTVNVCRDLLRRGKRDVPLDIVSDSADATPDPEQSAVAAQQYRMVLDALRNCPRVNVKQSFSAIWKGAQRAKSPRFLGLPKQRSAHSFQQEERK